MKLPDTDLRHNARETVRQFMTWSAQYRDDHIDQIETWNKHYKVEESLRSYDGRAHTADGSSHEAVETIAPRLVEILTDNGLLNYKVAPVDEDKDEKLVRPLNALIESDLKMADSRKKLVESSRSLPKYGTIVVSTPWGRKTRSRNQPHYSPLEPVGVDESGAYIYEQRFLGYEKAEETIYEGVTWNLVDLKSCWLDPFTPDVDRAQGIVEERKVAFEDLRKEQVRTETVRTVDEVGRTVIVKTQRGHYFGDALDELEKKLDKETVKKESGDEKGNVKKEQDETTPRKEVNIKTYWGWFDYDGDGKAEDCIITLAGDDEMVIQLEPSSYPRRPYIVCRYIPLEGQTYGLGVLQILTKPQQLINDLQNQVSDDATQNLLPMYRRSPGSQVQDDELVYGNNKVIDAEEGEIAPFEHQIQLRHGWDTIMYLKESTKTMTGAERALQGQPMKYHTTATEVSSMLQEASARIVLTAIVMETELIVPLLERIIEYNREFMGRGKIVRLTNNPNDEQSIFDVTQNDLQGQWDITPLGATTYARKMKRRQEMMEFSQGFASIMQALGANPLITEQLGFDVQKFAKIFARTYDIPELETIFPAKPPQSGPLGLPSGMAGMLPGGNGGMSAIDQFVGGLRG